MGAIQWGALVSLDFWVGCDCGVVGYFVVCCVVGDVVGGIRLISHPDWRRVIYEE